ncbi:signal peptidase I [Idiomarina seosinensis]|uniref:Signal peptidase I n=1 Tax=Idiomarina seosinensis TaxID=281739 RepID=A0A432ZH64_9GAMM|nr:signal peptidase I [Idiomarina seosinensis]RUO77365.1 signal peptidase I [Idiomarina seosinensis]
MANYFSILLTVVTLVAGLLWLFDVLVLKPRREQGQQQNSITEFGQSVFPVLAVVLVLRSFLYEPFQIPSGSMMPTLLKGDFILVEKFAYGIKDPLFRSKLIETGEPERGDIAVFKYPLEPSVDYIKRIVGVPGDRIIYRNKHLFIQPQCANGESCKPLQVTQKEINTDKAYFSGGSSLNVYQQTLGGVEHKILLDPRVSPRVPLFYEQPGTSAGEFIVPEGHYFAMGDNRDNSQDSRYWGFVSDDYLVGRAFFVWMSFEMDRGPDSLLPSWVPTGVRFERLGSIE